MSDAYNGNNSVSINQRRYLGSKTKLLGFIDKIILDEKIEFSSFADIFGGTGVVANHYYNRSNIIVNDILDSNSHIYHAFFGKEKIRENKLITFLAYYNALNPQKHEENYFSINFSNTYFDSDNAKRIGIIRDDIEEKYNSKQISPRERSYLLTSLIYALDKIANTVGHYDAYRKIEIPKKILYLLPLKILKSEYSSEIYKMDANELVKKIKADIVYIDPPYNSRQYSDTYHLLENIATWKKEKVYGVAKKSDRSQLKSKYNMKSAGLAFCDLIKNIDAKHILVSYNDMGTSGDIRSQSRISDHEILSSLKLRGNVKVYQTSFKQFNTGKSNKSDLMERIFLCKVSELPKTSSKIVASSSNPVKEGYIKSPLNYTGGKYKLLSQITKYFPNSIESFYDVFSGGSNVGINSSAQNIICIENNRYVVDLLKLIQRSNFESLHQQIIGVIEKFGLSQSYIHGYRYYNADSSQGLGQYNKNSFINLRSEYNKDKSKLEYLLVLILYSFNNQIRFNKDGNFNLPVGKRDYNGNSRRNLAAFNQISNEKKILFKHSDFRIIENMDINARDFVYLDPPYLLGMASYNEQGGWTVKDEVDLYKLLDHLDKINVKFALSNVLSHKGKSNEILIDWYKNSNYKVHKLDFQYNNSNYQTHSKEHTTIEVLITNY